MAVFSSTFSTTETPAELATFDGGLFVCGPASWNRVLTAAGACSPQDAAAYVAFRLATSSPGGTVGNEQYAKCTIAGIATNYWFGPAVRIQGTGASQGQCYHVEVNQTTNFNVYKVTDGGSIGQTQLGSSIAVTPVNGDLIELRATGTTTTTLKVFRNGSQIGPDFTDSSSALQNGQPGGWFFANAPALPQMTDWEGGDLTTAIQTPELYQSSNPQLAMWQAFSVCSF